MRDLGICEHCEERPATHFRAVGSDSNRFVWEKFERWCTECEDEIRARVDAILAEAREKHKTELYPGYAPCVRCGNDRHGYRHKDKICRYCAGEAE